MDDWTSLAEETPKAPPAATTQELTDNPDDDPEWGGDGLQEGHQVVGQKKGRKVTKGKPPKGVPASSPLAKLLAGAERLRILKRRQDGTKGFVNDYSVQDLEGFDSFETFICRYAKPRYGPGTYYVRYKNEKGEEIEMSPINIEEELPPTPEKDASHQVQILMEMRDQLRREAKEDLDERSRLMEQANPVKGLSEYAQASKLIKGDDAQMSMMMQMMMQQQQQQQQQQMQMMMQLRGKRDDDGPTVRLLEKLIEMIAAGQTAKKYDEPPALPPMLVSPPPEKESLLDAIKALAEILRPSTPEKDPLDVATKLVELTSRSDEKITTKDVLQIIKDAQQKPTDDFSKTLQQINALEQFVDRRSGKGGDPSFASLMSHLWDTLPERAGAISEMFQKKDDRDGSGRERLPSGSPQMPAGFSKLTKAMVEAKDDNEVVETTLAALQSLMSHQDWRKIPLTLLKQAKEGDNEKALETMEGFLRGLVNIQLLEEERAAEILDVFTENWQEILDFMGLGKADENQEGSDTPRQ